MKKLYTCKYCKKFFEETVTDGSETATAVDFEFREFIEKFPYCQKCVDIAMNDPQYTITLREVAKNYPAFKY